MSTSFENLILRDIAANRPAAGIPGRLFYDTTNSILQRDNGATWDNVEGAGGSGDVIGPATSADNTIARFNGTDNKTIQASLATVDDSGGVNIPTGQTYNINSSPHTHAGGGGDSTFTAAYGSRPAAGSDGDLFLPSDGFVVQRDTGAAWVPWGPLYPFTQPVSGDFAWINQGGAAITDGGGGVFMRAPVGASDNHRIRKKAAPSAPYTIDIAFLPMMIRANYFGCGFYFRQSSDGKLVAFYISGHSPFAWVVEHWSSPTAYSATPLTLAYNLNSGIVFMRAKDDNTNRIFSVSGDGQNWIQIYSQARTTFLTADEVGWGIYLNNGTYEAGMTLLHWKQS